MNRRSSLRWSLFLLSPLVAGSLACEYFHRTPGEKLWRKKCASCHGIDASGNTPQYMGNDRADLRDDSWYGYGGDDAGIETTIREGVFAKMPANDDLTSAEMRALIGHLRYLRGEAAE
jgi:mono/diheme cytochrome c family protein